ncbi:MAG: hypothetical protein M1827_005827 [Pycnora praestabilis]|nr:MAG: hypothetical protein M1827_005827 [Pycnora praestabilis]
MAPSNEDTDITALRTTTATTLSLLAQFITTLAHPTNTTPTSNIPADPPSPLNVLHTSSKLLKAQVTKLSLLLLNKPFTPTAIIRILRELCTTCLPAMMSAVEICKSETYGRVLQGEVNARVRRVMGEMVGLVGEIKVDELKGDQKATKEEGTGRDTLGSTGGVWEACDALTDLQERGLVGLVVRKAEEYRDMISDAISELKEWSEEDAEDEEDDGEHSDDDESESNGVTNHAQQEIDDLFGASKKLPKGDVELRAQLEGTIKRLKMIGMLYQALIKRRLKTFPPLPPTILGLPSEDSSPQSQPIPHIKTLDALIDILQAIPSEIDELASAFYDLDREEAHSQLKHCCEHAKKAAESVKESWKGQEDEFTAWLEKWLLAMDKN